MGMPYEQRLNRLRSRLIAGSVEAALLTSPSSIAYLTGLRSDPMERFLALWLGPDGGVVLFVPELDTLKADAAIGVHKIVSVPDGHPPLELLGRERAKEPMHCGVEKEAMNWRLAESLQVLWPATRFIDIGEELQRLRGDKTVTEAERVKEAARIGDKALEAALSLFKRGMRERELAEEIDRQIRLASGEGNAFATTVLSGRKSAYPHGETGDDPILENEFLLIDMGARSGGYLSDMTRTFLVGQGHPEQVRMYETVKEANRRAIAAVVPGAPLAAVDRAARDWIGQVGYGGFFPHRVGHGLGMEIHEPPSIHGCNDRLIAPGMLFTIEPGIYVPGVGGVRIEDDVYVNEKGAVEVLTRFPKEMRRL